MSDFLQEIEIKIHHLSNRSNIDKPCTLYYRGQADCQWDTVPSIFREQKLLRNEDKILKMVFSRCPSDFSEDKTLFEKLVRMQHFGFPTRLLDITLSPLVALFFACKPCQNNADGIVYMRSKKDKLISFSSEKDISTISHISMLNYDQKVEMSEACIHSQSRLTILHDEIRLKTVPKNKIEDRIKEIFYEFNEFQTCKKLKELTEEAILFKPIPFPSLLYPSTVQPTLKNDRIKAQQGLFIIFGLEKCVNLFKDESSDKIIIPAASKATLRKELDHVGINSMTMFPDFPGMGQYIRDYI